MIDGRRYFLKWLALLPFAPIALRTEAKPKAVWAGAPPTVYLLNVFSVAGFQYHEGQKVLRRLRTGELLTLKAEPENPHDEFAVRIERLGTMLGYVPRSDNRHISRLLRQGVRLTCRIVEADCQARPWNQVRVEVAFRG